jgi:hypothetical protein
MWKCRECPEVNAEPRWECRNCGVARRRDPRIRINWFTGWGLTERCEEFGRITSLGMGGCFIQTGKALGRGAPVYVLLELPSARVVRGEVRYHLERVGLGVQFAGLTGENRDDLRTLLEDFDSSVGDRGA